MKTIAFAAAVVAATVAVSAASTPAFAQETNAANIKVRYDVAADRYCVRATVPSAIVPVVQCRSKTEWARNGVTINHIKPAVQLARR